MTRRFLFAVALFALGAVAHAQQLPPGKWWQRPEVVQELQLTSEQQQRLDEVFRAAANDLIDAKAAVEKLQIAIRGELDRPQVRRQGLLRIASQLSDARGRLFERELMMLVDMRGVLTEQQWMRARNFLDRMHQPQRGNQGPNRRPQPRGRRP
jgi:hypothetical protein